METLGLSPITGSCCRQRLLPEEEEQQPLPLAVAAEAMRLQLPQVQLLERRQQPLLLLRQLVSGFSSPI